MSMIFETSMRVGALPAEVFALLRLCAKAWHGHVAGLLEARTARWGTGRDSVGQRWGRVLPIGLARGGS